MRRGFAALLAALLLLPAALAANQASYGPVTFYTDKASYLPGDTVTFTIVVKDRPNFRGQIDIYIYRNGNLEYLWHYPQDNGTAIVFRLETVGNDSVITFSKVFTDEGFYEARISVPDLNIPANAVAIQFSVAPNYQIAGKVVNEKGAPVAGATVVVKTPAGDKIASTATGNDGSFVVSVPSPGTYIVCAKADRYLKNSTTVEVRDIGVTNAGTIVIESIDHAVATIRADLADLRDMLMRLEENFSQAYASYIDAMQRVQQILADITARLDNAEAAIGELQTRSDALAQDLDAVKGQLAQLQQALEQYKQETGQRLDQLAAAIDQVNNKLGELDQRLSQVEQSYATKDEVQQLQQQLQQLNKDLADLRGKVDNLEQATIKNLSNQLNKLTERLDQLSNDIAGASRNALIAVVLAVIGIIVAIVANITVYRRIA